ncbi:MAG: hypothetical protein IJ567_03470 [Lachnospiraceae bacterium]|nr:hypothetical protein [Lachnospiraceae bacterium]
MSKIKGIHGITGKREVEDMAALAKPINRIAVIKRQESQEFVREFNENKVSKDFLNSCKKAGRLFGKRK